MPCHAYINFFFFFFFTCWNVFFSFFIACISFSLPLYSIHLWLQSILHVRYVGCIRTNIRHNCTSLCSSLHEQRLTFSLFIKHQYNNGASCVPKYIYQNFLITHAYTVWRVVLHTSRTTINELLIANQFSLRKIEWKFNLYYFNGSILFDFFRFFNNLKIKMKFWVRNQFEVQKICKFFRIKNHTYGTVTSSFFFQPPFSSTFDWNANQSMNHTHHLKLLPTK